MKPIESCKKIHFFPVKSRSQSKEGANGWFAKFPQDVIRCEKLTGGDQKILEKEPFKETPSKAVNYKEIFVDPEAEKSEKKGAAAKRKSTATPNGSPKKKSKASDNTPSRPISHPRFKPGGEQHQVRIMQQPSTPYHLDLQKKEESKSNSANNYTCHICGFSASRLNVIILHNKSHSEPSANNGASKTAGAKAKAKAAASSSISTPRGGRKKAESTPVKSRAKKTETPKKAVGKVQTPKAEKATNGRGSRKAVDKAEETPKSTEKKPRMTKKKKEEMAKKEQEKKLQKKKILGDWDEEEDGEAEKEEKKKIKANIEGAEDSEMSEAESDQEAYFQDDNIQGNVYGDEDDEELFQDPEPPKSPPKKEEEKKEAEEEKKVDNDDNDDALASVAKILEETKVPEIDTSISESPSASKKSVKFSEQVAKEIAITKMALVQPKSNMAGPMEVEDEFAEGDEELEPKASTAKKILKKRSLSPPPPKPSTDSEDEEEEEGEQQEEDPTTTQDEIEKVTTSTEEAPTANDEVTESTDKADVVSEVEQSNEASVSSTEMEETAVTTTEEADNSEKSAAETMLELGSSSTEDQASTAAPEASKDTYLLVVDDANQLDQLNDSQTYYIDSNSLANGDLSNMVLATDQPTAATNGHETNDQQ